MSAQIRFLCPTCKAVMEAPVERAGNKINCLKCGQRMQVPPAERAKTVLSPALGIDDDNVASPMPSTAVQSGSPPPSTTEQEHGPQQEQGSSRWYPERFIPMLAWGCYGGLWVSFAANCIAILMPNMGLLVVVGIVSIILTAVTLCLALYTFAASASLWGGKKSGTAVAGLVSSTLTTIVCTLVLMCDCGTATMMMKGFDLVTGALGGGGGVAAHRRDVSDLRDAGLWPNKRHLAAPACSGESIAGVLSR